MTMYTIEKSFPVPDGKKYPFPKMGVGDSFFTDNEKVRSTSFQFGKYWNKKFTVRAVEGGFRCWRTA